MTGTKQVVEFIKTKKKEIATVAMGQSIYSLLGWVYDNPLYIAAIVIYGPLGGGALMTFGSFVISLGLILWYNQRGVDWLGVAAVDSLRELSLHYAGRLVTWRADSILGKLLFVIFFLPIRLFLVLARLANHQKWGEPTAFVLLSIYEDPFVTTAYLRHGNYGPMMRKDWQVFVGSTFLSNGYWILRTTVVIEIALLIWNAL